MHSNTNIKAWNIFNTQNRTYTGTYYICIHCRISFVDLFLGLLLHWNRRYRKKKKTHDNSKTHINMKVDIFLWFQGRANITQCNVTPKTTTTTTTTTTSTTTPRPAPTTTTTPAGTTTTERPTVNETRLFRKINQNEMGRQLTGPTENDDMTFDDPSEEVVPSVEAGTESTIQTNGKSVNKDVW